MANIITIIRWDSTDYEGDPILIININTENDLTGYKGKFQVGSITKEYENVTSKSVNVVLDKTETESLPVGRIYGAFKLYDTAQRAKTIVKNIIFQVEEMQVKND